MKLPESVRQPVALKDDLVAGVTTAVMLIPQAMAYAILAGLPPVVGLYASIGPLIAYALSGSSRQLAVGPVALLSLLVLTSVSAFAEPGSARFVALATLLALLMGGAQLIMGLLRLGFLTNFLSNPVLAGFTSAAALIIALNQLGPLLGLELPGGHNVIAIVSAALRRAPEVHPATATIGAFSIAALLLCARFAPRAPRALLVVAASTIAVVALDLGAGGGGVAVVGTIPRGLPAPSLPLLELEAVVALLPVAIVVAMVAFMESLAAAKAVARRHGDEIAPNRELVALGLSNVTAGFFGAYPVTGGFARSVVNDQAGAKTRLAGVVTAAVAAVSVSLLAPLFTNLPRAALAAIIIVAITGLIDVSEVRRLWRVKRGDLVLLVLTFGATLALGVVPGILAGVGTSLLWFIVRSTRPHFAILGRLPKSGAFRNIAHYPEAETIPGVLVLRIDSQLYFGNVGFLKTTLRKLLADSKERVHMVVLDAGGINQLDSSAATALVEIALDLSKRDMRLVLANVKCPVEVVLQRAGVLRECAMFLSLDEAVRSAGGACQSVASPDA